MENKNMLMIPGPTPVPEAVLLAMAKAPIGHRTGAFSKVIAELTENL
ncbi:MAG: alanine--glyoxylate aminotransferase family protein, partial [Microcystis panniformis]